MARNRTAGIVVTALGVGIVAVGIAMPLTSGAETWWAPTIVGALIAVVGGIVAWFGWINARPT